MRIFKVIAGLVCLLAAMLPGSLVISLLSHFGKIQTLKDVFIAFVFVVFTLGLVASGLFLIARRCSPLSKRAIVLVASALIIPVLIGMPAFVRARTTSASNACVNNLRQIDAAKQQWALENNLSDGSGIHPTWNNIRPYLGRGPQGEVPHCPQGGTYILARLDEKPRCSIGGSSHSIE
jgi:hypothetical protein